MRDTSLGSQSTLWVCEINWAQGPYLMVQWLRLYALTAGGHRFDSWLGSSIYLEVQSKKKNSPRKFSWFTMWQQEDSTQICVN